MAKTVIVKIPNVTEEVRRDKDMKQTIRLQDIYSADLFTRSRASELRACINDEANEVTLDFEGIGFMSSSFADEVCNIIDDLKDKVFTFTGQNNDVATMMTKVREGRSHERKRPLDLSYNINAKNT